MMTGIGGDLFVMYWDAKTGKLTGLNASGPSPKALSPAFLAQHDIKTMPSDGIHSVTVPGAVQGWYRMHQRFGKLRWKDLFQDAIAFAENGFPVYEGAREVWADPAIVKRLEANAESKRVFLPGGKAPHVGQLFKNPEMAHALRLIAEQGPDAFYKGEIAGRDGEDVRTSRRHDDGAGSGFVFARVGGTALDRLPGLARLRAAAQWPRDGRARDAQHHGDRAALAAGRIQRAEMHKRIEAMKLAYSDMHANVADPRTHDIPTGQLLSKEYARKRAALIDPHRANCEVENGRSDRKQYDLSDHRG